MRFDDEFLGGTLVEVEVTFWRVVEPDYSYLDCLRDLNPVMENCLHQLAVVLS